MTKTTKPGFQLDILENIGCKIKPFFFMVVGGDGIARNHVVQIMIKMILYL